MAKIVMAASEKPFELYRVLEISSTADLNEVNKAHRRLAKRFHPDKGNGDSDRFVEVQNAYEVLSDENRRAEYDKDCQIQMAREAERKYREAEREKRSAVYKYKNPSNIKESLMEQLRRNLARKFGSLFSDSILQKVLQDIDALVPEIREKFRQHPFEEKRRKIAAAERRLAAGEIGSRQFSKDVSDYEKDYSGVDASFWKKRLESLKQTESKKSKGQNLAEIKNNANTQVLQDLQRHLLKSWRESYEQELLRWMMTVVEQSSSNLEAKYSKYLRNLQTIRRILGTIPSLGWDLSLAELQSQDIQEVIRYGKFLEDNSRVKELCELMGRMQKAAAKIERIRIRKTIAYEQIKKDYNSREEISGVTFSNRIEDALPQELALLSDEDTSILFDLKFIEKRLLSFEKMGYVAETKSKTIEKEIEKKEEEKKGPIIVCVDTSGSMAGFPETLAKAVTLCLAGIAHTQNRNCYLINFSTTIETFDFCPPKGMKDLIKFLKSSFHGGTDVMPALQEGLKMMESASYKNSDLLVISDFMFPVTEKETVSQIAQQRKKKNRFYALTISEASFPCVEMNQIFDAAWNYSPSSLDLQKLNMDLSDIGHARFHI